MGGYNKMGRLDVLVTTLIILMGLGYCGANHTRGALEKRRLLVVL
jgi:hypothetical protein